jgi:predicted transcriptional regulator
MAKRNVYSWRLSAGRKSRLEHVAREENTNVSGLLEQAMDEWLAKRAAPDDEDVQQRLRQAAAPFVGAVRGGDPTRSANVRVRVRAALARRRDR